MHKPDHFISRLCRPNGSDGSDGLDHPDDHSVELTDAQEEESDCRHDFERWFDVCPLLDSFRAPR